MINIFGGVTDQVKSNLCRINDLHETSSLVFPHKCELLSKPGIPRGILTVTSLKMSAERNNSSSFAMLFSKGFKFTNIYTGNIDIVF
jgi:hypothetical protein